MDEYLIEKIDINGYDRYLLCLTFESIMNYLSEIESSPSIMNCSGKLLIDQLLVTGNGDNRFISCNFKNGKLDMDTAHSVKPDDCFRTITIEWLHNNYAYVENSILTEYQRQCIKEYISF